jgi:hypothetical protein
VLGLIPNGLLNRAREQAATKGLFQRLFRGSASADLSFCLFVAAGIVGLIQLSSAVEFGAGYEMFAEAKSLAAQGSFANPFETVTSGYTAVNPPLYPLVLAVLIKLLAVPSWVLDAAVIGSIVANASTAALLPRISLLFYGDIVPGAVAAVFWLLAMRVSPAWDTSYTVAGTLLFCLFSARTFSEGRNPIRFGALVGGFGGLLALLNPSSALITLPWIAHLVSRRKVTGMRAGKYCAFLAAAFLVVVSAWALRNRQRLGSLVLRTNLGMTLYASNNDCAESSLAADQRFGCYQAHHPKTSESEAALFSALGEVEYDRLRVSDAKTWALAHPGRFRQLTAKRILEFWFPPPAEHPYTEYAIWLATVLAIPGLILMLKSREPVSAFLIGVQLMYPPIYYLVVTDVRYRLPVLWLSLLAAGYSICAVARKIPEWTGSEPARAR